MEFRESEMVKNKGSESLFGYEGKKNAGTGIEPVSRSGDLDFQMPAHSHCATPARQNRAHHSI